MKLLTIKQVIEKTELSRATVYRYLKKGIFPSPRRLDSKTIRWIESDIIDWIEGLPI